MGWRMDRRLRQGALPRLYLARQPKESTMWPAHAHSKRVCAVQDMDVVADSNANRNKVSNRTNFPFLGCGRSATVMGTL